MGSSLLDLSGSYLLRANFSLFISWGLKNSFKTFRGSLDLSNVFVDLNFAYYFCVLMVCSI